VSGTAAVTVNELSGEWARAYSPDFHLEWERRTARAFIQSSIAAKVIFLG